MHQSALETESENILCRMDTYKPSHHTSHNFATVVYVSSVFMVLLKTFGYILFFTFW